MNELDPMMVVLVGAFLPLVLAVVNQPQWSSNVRALVSFGVIMAVSVGVAWLTDHLDRDGIMATCAAIWVMAQASYSHFWKPTSVAPSIERVTSGTGNGGTP